MKKLKIAPLLLVIALGQLGVAAANETDSEVAVSSTKHWLSLVDTQKYDESWKESASFFRSKVSQKAWKTSIGQARKPLGDLVTRKLLSSNPMTSLPGAPDGQYVVIQFTTSFKNKKDAVETVTPMLDQDGKWRVSGYFIK